MRDRQAHRSEATEWLWWQTGVIYQIYPRSFQDSNGDGVGDLPGILERLDYIANDLGVDAVWLSPFYPSPMADFGYDVADYTDVHPLFGTLADFDALVAAAHARAVRVIIDFVPNHTSDQHPWFQQSRSSRDNPKRDWYVWKDAKPDGSAPNNWLSVFGGGAWEWDETTGQYYLHTFVREQPDLNWRNPDVKNAMFDVLRFWLDRGVDGFRIDVAHFVMKDPNFRDNPEIPADAAPAARAWDRQQHVNNLGHPDVHGVYADMRSLLDSYGTESPRVSIGEIYELDWQKWASYYGEHLDELHMPFNFALLTSAWTASDVRGVVEAVENAVADGAWPNYVLGNHDTHRLASRLGAAQAKAALLLLLTLRGTPTLYYGEELGMRDVEIPPEYIQDPFEINVPGLGLGRDPERTPMQWSSDQNAGFTSGSPWLPVANDVDTVNVLSERADPGSTLSMVRRCLQVRKASQALHSGNYRSVVSGDADVYTYLREDEKQRFLVAINFADGPRPLNLGESGRALCRISTHARDGGDMDIQSITLEAHEGLLVELLGEQLYEL